MEYRVMKDGSKASLLGFGCMRFPVTAEGHIDEPKAKEMLLKAYENGITYYDTAYPYHNGESERFVGKVMSELPRDTFTLATKMPTWAVSTLDDAKRIFAEQLDHLRTDYVDYYLIHALNKDSWKKMKDLGVVELLEGYQKEGKIKNYGFSFHDNYETFVDILNYRDWDFCQIQFNYIDKDTQATLKGVDLCREKNIPLVIMEPVKGGSLAKLPEEIFKKIKPFRPEYTPSAWALAWVATFKEVRVVLSGMTEMEQLDNNLATFDKFTPLSDKEMEAIDQVAKDILARTKNGCTGCRYCMPCPMGVDIPGNFRVWNTFHRYGNVGGTKFEWGMIKKEARPDACVKCGACEGKCPQKISIRADLETLNKELSAL